MVTTDFILRLETAFAAHADRFREPDGTLSPMMQLKLDHTRRVVDDARRIMEAHDWPESRMLTGLAAAWLHDIGRFTQLRTYGTFRDQDSVDHARLSAEIVEAERLLDLLSPDTRGRIMTAIRLHNVRLLPDLADADTLAVTHLVRDADKLDIFTVLHTQLAQGVLEKNPEIFWGLAIRGPVSADVAQAVIDGTEVDYAWVKSLSDFVLIQVGWLTGGLRFDASRRLAKERGVLETREDLLRRLTDDPVIDACCDAARRALAAV